MAYVISAEQMKNVRTYIPLKAKTAFVHYVAGRCIDRLDMNSDEASSFTVPPMYKEATEKKCRYMMYALVCLYIGADKEFVQFEEDDEFLMTMDSYDQWSEGHIMNQIERLKSDSDVRNTCFNLMQDYKDLEKKVNTEIYGLINVLNDPVTRLAKMLSAGMTPEAMQGVMDGLKVAQEELEKYKTEESDE